VLIALGSVVNESTENICVPLKETHMEIIKHTWAPIQYERCLPPLLPD
jgi:hypothetical protein